MAKKRPAFSARTLTLPPPQTDNTAHIIEHTRHMYSRDRADVEKSIHDLVNSANPQAQTQPQSQSLAKNWPIDAPNKPVQVSTAPSDPKSQQTPAEQASAQPPKKKRTRSRKKKSSTSGSFEQNTLNNQDSKPTEHETIVKLR